MIDYCGCNLSVAFCVSTHPPIFHHFFIHLCAILSSLHHLEHPQIPKKVCSSPSDDEQLPSTRIERVTLS
jgi:hypothetical protein